MYDYCDVMDIDEPYAPSLSALVKSDRPALVFNGYFDPIMPPQNAIAVAKGLTNSNLVIIPGGHGASLSDECPRNIAQRFLNDPQAPLDTQCIEEMTVLFNVPKVTGYEPFVSQQLNIRGIRPQRWLQVSPGTFARFIYSGLPNLITRRNFPFYLAINS